MEEGAADPNALTEIQIKMVHLLKENDAPPEQYTMYELPIGVLFFMEGYCGKIKKNSSALKR